MDDLIKSSEASLALCLNPFIFRDTSKGVFTIVTICHQFGPLKAQVIQKIVLLALHFWRIFSKCLMTVGKQKLVGFFYFHIKFKILSTYQLSGYSSI